MLWLRYPNLTLITTLTCTEVNQWLRKELSVSSSPAAEQLIFIQKAKKDLLFSNPKTLIWKTLFCNTLFYLVALQGWDQSSEMERPVNTKFFLKHIYPSKKPLLTTRKISLKIFRQNCSKEPWEETIREQGRAHRKWTTSMFSLQTKAKSLFSRNSAQKGQDHGLLSPFLQV